VSDDWEAVSAAVSMGLTELQMTHKELAKLSGVSHSVVLDIVNHPGKRRPKAPILRAISWELGWSPRYLENLVNGHPQPEAAPPPTAGDVPLEFLQKILAILQRQLGAVVDIIYNDSSRFDITVEIKHPSQDGQANP
jgi:hypothetical protein